MTGRLQSLAFYLPQFHPVPENDRWWGPGFTEWTQLARAEAWYPGHRVRRPIPPLGRYSLEDAATIEAQYALARAHGIDGFLVWNYWFGGGRQLLERPAALMLQHGLDVRYAFAWANHDWVDKARRRTLMPQHYLGPADYADYFMHCLPHFRSPQYVRVDGKPLFYLYRPEHVPDLDRFVATWRALAGRHGLPGLYLVGDVLKDRGRPPAGLDAYSQAAGVWSRRGLHRIQVAWRTLLRRYGLQRAPQRFAFDEIARGVAPDGAPPEFVPTVLTGWDTTPRHGANGVILDDLTPQAFRRQLEDTVPQLLRQPAGRGLLLVKSWNEWAEGNHLEPDDVHGDALLREFRDFADGARRALAAGGTRQGPASERAAA